MSSLPVPLSPMSKMVLLVEATRATVRYTLQEVAPLTGSPDGQTHFCQVERLADIIISSIPNGLHGRLHAPESCHDDHREVGVERVQCPEDFYPVQIWQAEVRQDRIERAGASLGQGLLAAFGLVDRVPFLL